jgi:hypothetical protein
VVTFTILGKSQWIHEAHQLNWYITQPSKGRWIIILARETAQWRRHMTKPTKIERIDTILWDR